MTATHPRHAPISIPELREVLSGPVIAPGTAAYDQARQLFYGGFDQRPAAIVRPTDAAGVARVVALARDSGLELAVRGGGHSLAGHSTTQGGIVLDLADLHALDIDLEGGTAWAQGGLTAGAYTTAVAAHGLATGFGDTASVGIGGLTLGGGIGYLVRKHGLTIDSLLAAELVTADGHLLQVDDQHHPELFWALRGGGGNFGVATRLQYRLQPVATIVGGLLVLPATPETISGFLAAAEAAPEELSTIANILPAPPLPFLAPDHHGRLVIMATLAYAGHLEAGQRAVAPLRALAAPLADLVRPMPYPQLYPPEEAGYHPTAVVRTMFVDAIDHQATAAIVEHLQAATAPMRAAQLRVLGGAMARVPAEATAFAHRTSRFMVNVAAVYHHPQDAAEHRAWVDRFAAALQDGDARAYVNFLGDEGQGRIREAYPPSTWARLAAVKARYDPTNLFRRNQNIPPAPGDPDDHNDPRAAA
jgi:FAD/FMN-containing dehydrogenase